MTVIEAINEPNFEDYYNPKTIKMFLAGGITDCPNWQDEVIENLKGYDLENLMIFNPRRKEFDVTDKSASRKQIEWEYKFLNDMDLFTMYFSSGESTQPICMYELGRHLERMQHRFPRDWKKRIIIGIEEGYCRTQDVIIQTDLASGIVAYDHIDTDYYAQMIRHNYLLLSR